MDITYIIGLVFLIGFGLCSLFMAIDGLSLQSQQAIATIVDRKHRDAVMGHRIEIVNQRPLVTPHVTNEKYILKLDIDGRQTEGRCPGTSSTRFDRENRCGSHFRSGA